MMHEIISTTQWLQIIAAQLEQDGYPAGFSQRLRNVATVMEAHTAEVTARENEATRYGVDLAKTEEHAFKLFADLKETWRRYVSVLAVLEKYDPVAAEEFAQYKPFFHASLS